MDRFISRKGENYMGSGFLTKLLAGAVVTGLLASFPAQSIHPQIPENILAAACEKQIELFHILMF